jgi:two-component system, NarL family, invasion response regulator UvrY
LAVSSVRVLTVDDHAAFRAAARALVAATAGFESVGEATTAEEGIAAAIRLRPDVVLLDVTLPGMDGYEAARRLAPALPDTMICLVSAADGAILGDYAARCGARAVIRKQDLRPSVLQALWKQHAPPPAPPPAG